MRWTISAPVYFDNAAAAEFQRDFAARHGLDDDDDESIAELCEPIDAIREAMAAVPATTVDGLMAKAQGLASRSAQLTRWARGRRFDLAIGHGSNDITVAAALLRIPCSTTFDYELATVQHTVNCRLDVEVHDWLD